MDLQRSRNPEVTFDLLQQFVSSVTCREAQDVSPLGSGWSSLVVAFDDAGVLHDGAGWTESALRQLLVHSYMAQSAEGTSALIRAKMPSFFGRLGHADAQSARQHWHWYLLSLSQVSTEPLVVGLMRVGLDLLDLQLLATALGITITVSQMMEEPVRLQPRGGQQVEVAIHLIHHAGYWAPLLRRHRPLPRPSEKVGSIVELSDIASEGSNQVVPWLFSSGPVRLGVVMAYIPEHEAYLVNTPHGRLLVDRFQIVSIVHGTQNSCRVPADLEPRLRRPLDDHVLDWSLDWHILHQLVRLGADAQLFCRREQFSGKARTSSEPYLRRLFAPSRMGGLEPVPELVSAADEGMLERGPNGHKVSSVDASKILATNSILLLDFERLQRYVHAGCKLSVLAVQEGLTAPSEPSPKIVIGQELRILRVRGEWVLLERSPLRETPVRHPVVSSGAADGSGSSSPKTGAAAKPAAAATVNGTSSQRMPEAPRPPPPPFPPDSHGDLQWPAHWRPCDHILAWRADREFQPSYCYRKGAGYLALAKDDMVVITKRFHGAWEGWAYAKRLGSKPGSGIVHLSFVKPKVCVKRWFWEC